MFRCCKFEIKHLFPEDFSVRKKGDRKRSNRETPRDSLGTMTFLAYKRFTVSLHSVISVREIEIAFDGALEAKGIALHWISAH